ncbi:MAG TPA: hypothetical protein VJ763_10360 [Sphingomicrobium sp.]|nr:hypothetical protein [Sphingomicrobium sp.]
MTIQMKMLGFGAGLAAFAAAAPASAQYGYYQQPYGNAYGYYNNANVTQYAANRCTAEVNARLYNRTGITGLIGSLVGARTSARVLSITQVNPRRNNIRVRGLASSGRYAYNPYGIGYYGAVGAGYVPDLSFSCTVDYRGRIRDVDINRR